MEAREFNQRSVNLFLKSARLSRIETNILDIRTMLDEEKLMPRVRTQLEKLLTANQRLRRHLNQASGGEDEFN